VFLDDAVDRTKQQQVAGVVVVNDDTEGIVVLSYCYF